MLGLTGRIARKVARWIDPLAGTDAVQFKDSKEIALENAAHSLDADDEVHAERQRRRVGRRRAVAAIVMIVSALVLAYIVRVERAGEEPSWLDGPDAPVIRPGPDPIAGTLSLEMPGDGAKIVNSVYMDENDAVCSSLSKSTGGIAQLRTIGGCLKLSWLRERLAAECAISGGGGGAAGHIVVKGFAHEDVVGIEGKVPPVRGPERIEGPLRIVLSKPWVPDAAEGDSEFEPLRAFIVVARSVRRKVSPRGFDTAQYVNPYTYKLTARLANGQAAVLKGFGPTGEPAYGPGCGPT